MADLSNKLQGLSDACAAIRRAAGLTQRQVADRYQVDHNTISRWERGDVPPVEYVWTLEQYAGVEHGTIYRSAGLVT